MSAQKVVNNSNNICIDIGYSSTKVFYDGKVYKFPTAISYAVDVGLAYGSNKVYNFEGENYFVGNEAVGSETFNTVDYKFFKKYAPLIIYHILMHFDTINANYPINLKTGLAIVDWQYKEEFIDRISKFVVNDVNIETTPFLIPQGTGIYLDWLHNYSENGEDPTSAHILDIGFNTINSVHFENGKPIRSKTNSYPGHGVSSVIKPFVSYLENKFFMPFSNSEALNYFINKKFIYNGENVEEVVEKIKEFKTQMVKRLFQSVLVNEKKVLSTSEIVIIGGGGGYLIQNFDLPKNVFIIPKDIEFSNVKGYSYE